MQAGDVPSLFVYFSTWRSAQGSLLPFCLPPSIEWICGGRPSASASAIASHLDLDLDLT